MNTPGSLPLLASAILATALCSLAACQDSRPSERGLGDTIRVFAWPEHPLPNEETLNLVEDIFGMEVVISETSRGAITLYYTEYVNETGNLGYATATSCSPQIVQSPMAPHRSGARGRPHPRSQPCRRAR